MRLLALVAAIVGFAVTLGAAASEIEAPGHPLIETKPKVGYRLTLAAPEIGFMA